MKTSRLQLKRMIKAALLKEGSSYSEAERKQAVQQALDAVAKAVQILQKYAPDVDTSMLEDAADNIVVDAFDTVGFGR
jgi:heterodisulfide reductase subunit A-like polyferredoxin